MKVSAEMSNPLEFNPSFLPDLRAHQQIQSNKFSWDTKWIPDCAAIPEGWTRIRSLAVGEVAYPEDGDGELVRGEFVHAHGDTGILIGGVSCNFNATLGQK